jgi:uncharacterized protein
LDIPSTFHDYLIHEEIRRLNQVPRFRRTHCFVQHGGISVFDHSVSVARLGCRIAERLHFRVDYASLVRGALLHDYFLYDWHDKAPWHRWHGFRHPYIAWKNAKADFRLTRKESIIILRHMFPLTVIPPSCVEGWVVCVADKLCATEEISRHIADRIMKTIIGAIDFLI